MAIVISMKYIVIVPTLNAANDWARFARALSVCIRPQSVLIVDSESTDGTADLARAAGFHVYTVARTEFDHGGTRQFAAELLPDAEIFVFMTQDAVLTDSEGINALLKSFADRNVAAAFGRQLPHPDATPIEAHARLFNYPAQSCVRTLASREQLGIKTIFISNSFAAYRRGTFMDIGGFPRNVIFGEDTITTAKMLLAGWKIAYVAEAQMYHSHSYSGGRISDVTSILESCTRERIGCSGNMEIRAAREVVLCDRN